MSLKLVTHRRGLWRIGLLCLNSAILDPIWQEWNRNVALAAPISQEVFKIGLDSIATSRGSMQLLFVVFLTLLAVPSKVQVVALFRQPALY